MKPRPTNNHFLAIIFPVSENLRPTLMYLDAPLEPAGTVFKRNPDHITWYPGNAGHRSPRTSIMVGGGDVEDLGISYNPFLKRDLKSYLHVAVRDTYLIDGSPHNESIARLATETGRADGDWRGNIIAFALSDRQYFPAKLRDINLADLRHVVDYLLSYSSSSIQAFPLSLSTQVTAVKINCFGDRTSDNLPLLETWSGNVSNFRNFSRQYSDIAGLVGIPLFSFHLTYHFGWSLNSAYQTRSPWESEEISLLHLCCNLERFDPNMGHMGWGKPAQKR